MYYQNTWWDFFAVSLSFHLSFLSLLHPLIDLVSCSTSWFNSIFFFNICFVLNNGRHEVLSCRAHMKNNNFKTCKSCKVLGVLRKDCPWGGVRGFFWRRCSGGEWTPHGVKWVLEGITSWKGLFAVLSSADFILGIYSFKSFFSSTIFFFFTNHYKKPLHKKLTRARVEGPEQPLPSFPIDPLASTTVGPGSSPKHWCRALSMGNSELLNIFNIIGFSCKKDHFGESSQGMRFTARHKTS